MSLRRYETLMLTVPEITKDETAQLENSLSKMIQDAQGSLISFERWGKYRLSYPVRKNDYGVYFLLRFELEEPHKLLKLIDTYFKVKAHELVMRNFTTTLAADESLEYSRPSSLEDTPSRDVSSFLRENKMEGLLESVNDDLDEDDDSDNFDNDEK